MSKSLSNRLAVLAADIKATHKAIKASAEQMAEQAIAAGNLLIEAKAAVRHGEWRSWLDINVGMSERSAQRYMQLARSGMKSATVADLGIRAAVEALASSHPEPRRDGDIPDDILEWVAMWKCMIFSWARLPPKDRARARMKTVTQFASDPKGLQLIPSYLRHTEEMDRMVTSGEFNPFDMPVGDELLARMRKALLEMKMEEVV